MKNKMMSIVAIMLVLSVFLSACNKSSTGAVQTSAQTPAQTQLQTSSTPQGDTASVKPVEISFWYEPGGEAGKLLESLTKEFNDAHKDIHVTPALGKYLHFSGRDMDVLVRK